MKGTQTKEKKKERRKMGNGWKRRGGGNDGDFYRFFQKNTSTLKHIRDLFYDEKAREIRGVGWIKIGGKEEL